MGVKCQVIKINGSVNRVVAPNGKDSILYKDALDKAHLQDTALKVWATAYTDDFNLYYGDWKNDPQPDQDLDENGEPVLKDVETFLDSRRGIAPPLDDVDVSSLRSMMVSNGISDVDALNEAISPFVRGSEVRVDKRTLVESRLYNADEINRIISNPSVSSALKSVISKFNSMMLGVVPPRIRYLLTNEYDGELVYTSDNYNNVGKMDYINPYKIDSELRNAVGGIKDRIEFDQAFMNLPYDSLVDRYQSDSSFADEMYDRYSSLTKVNVSDPSGRPMTDTSYPILETYSYYNQKAASRMKSDIGALTSLESDVWAEEGLIKEGLRRVAENGLNMGIDLAGLEDSYDSKTQEEIEDFLLGLDVFVRSLAPGKTMDMSFSQDYDIFFGLGNPVTEAVSLNENEKPLNLVVYPYSPNALSDVELFESYGLIRLRDNIFHKVNSMETDQLYDTLYEINDAHKAVYGRPAFPVGNTSGKSKAEVIDMLKEWINRNTRFDQNERMAQNRAAFEFSLRRPSADIDVQRELNRFEERKNYDRFSSKDVLRLRSMVLKEKLKGSDLYNNVLYNIDFNPYGYSVSLKNSDPMSLRDMDMSVEGEMRDLLMRAALDSDSNIRDLFYLKNYSDIYKTIDFYKDLYQRHPELAPELSMDYETLEDGKIKTFYSGDLVMMESGVLMEKVAEDGGMSVFDSVESVNGRRAAEVLQSYSKPLSVEDFTKTNYLEKESELINIINKRSC